MISRLRGSYVSITSDFLSEACIWTLPQLSIPKPARCFGFTVRCIGASDKCPVLAQHAGQGTLSTQSVLPERGLLAQNLATQLERYRVGKPSLFSEEKCLSLHESILAQESKNGKEAALPPLAEAQRYPRRNRHEYQALW